MRSTECQRRIQGIPGFSEGWGDHGERASLNGNLGRSPQRGPEVEPPVGVRGLKLTAFYPFLYKKWSKVKDLNEKLPPCLRQTASRRHDQP